jgi:hypothetical protein
MLPTPFTSKPTLKHVLQLPAQEVIISAIFLLSFWLSSLCDPNPPVVEIYGVRIHPIFYR